MAETKLGFGKDDLKDRKFTAIVELPSENLMKNSDKVMPDELRKSIKLSELD